MKATISISYNDMMFNNLCSELGERVAITTHWEIFYNHDSCSTWSVNNSICNDQFLIVVAKKLLLLLLIQSIQNKSSVLLITYLLYLSKQPIQLYINCLCLFVWSTPLTELCTFLLTSIQLRPSLFKLYVLHHLSYLFNAIPLASCYIDAWQHHIWSRTFTIQLKKMIRHA